MRFSSIITVFPSLICQIYGYLSLPTAASDIVQIQQTLNLFPLSVDTKNYSLLADIFTSDVTANFLIGSVLHGLEAVQQQLETHLKGLVSHHSLTTQSVVVGENRDTASATSYLIANFFGQGDLARQVLTNYGQYADTLVRDPGTGGWKVNNRTLILTVSWNLGLREFCAVQRTHR